MKKVVALVAVLALALTAFVAVGLAIQGATARRAAARPTPSPTTPPPGVGDARRRSDALTEPLLPAHRLDAVRHQRRPRLRHPHRPGRLRRARGRDHRPRAAAGAGHRRARRLAGGQPGRARRARDVVRRCRGPRLPRAAAAGLRHRRLRPARDGRVGAGRLPERQRARRLPRRRPDPDTAAEEAVLPGVRAVLRRQVRGGAPARSSATSPRRGGPRHGRPPLGARRGEADLPRRVVRHQARARPTPSSSPSGSAAWCSTGRSTSRSTPEPIGARAGRPASRPRCAPTCRTASTRPTTASSATPSTRDSPPISDLLDSIEEQPLPAGDRELQVGNAFYGVITPLYNRDYWFLLSTALASALDGKGSALMDLADAYASRGPDGSYADNSIEANYSINCLDDPTSAPFAKVPSLFPAFEEASPTFGRIFAWAMTGCRGIEVTSSEEPLDISGRGCRADPGPRHHPRPGDAVDLGRGAGRRS